MKHCLSCASPIDTEEFRGTHPAICRYCSDEAGGLKSRAVVVAAVSEWFLSWQPGIDQNTAEARARKYLQAMPAWAD